jgi:hypothetical protein
MFGRFGFSSKRKSSDRPVEALEGADRYYREAWGFTAPQWQAMTVEQRRDYRERVSHAITRSVFGGGVK